MRKGVSFAEVLAAIGLVTVIAVVSASVFVPVAREMPRASRTVEAGRRLNDMLGQLRQDIDAARSLPAIFGELRPDEGLLIVELPDGVVAYQAEEGKVVRRWVRPAADGAARRDETWQAEGGGVGFGARHRGGRRIGVEVRTWIDYTVDGHVQRKLANAHVFFLGAVPPGRRDK